MENNNVSTDTEVRVRRLLDKRSNGDLIILDSAAFEPAGGITDPQCKDIATRLAPDLRYEGIQRELLQTVERKRAEMMAKAKKMVGTKMLSACQNLQVKLMNGVLVNRIDLLREYFKEASTAQHQKIIDAVTAGCFDQNDIWKDDMDHDLKEFFGIDYDPSSIRRHVNGKGTGFVKKIITKALCNLRNDLRQASARAQPYVAISPTRIKRSHEDSYSDGKYQRKKKVSRGLSTQH